MDVASPPRSRTDGASSRGCADETSFEQVLATKFFAGDGRSPGARRVDARAVDRPQAPGEGAPP